MQNNPYPNLHQNKPLTYPDQFESKTIPYSSGQYNVYPELRSNQPQGYFPDKPLHNPPKPQVEEHKKTEYSQDDLAKSIFKASQVSTNFRKAQTNKYKNLYKNNSNQAKLLESTFFPIGEENPGNIDIHNDISKLTHSFFAAAQKNSNNENKHGLVISRIDKKKVIEERKEGYLLKKNRFFFQKSRRRFCKIKNRKFLYYDTKKNNNALGCIDFDSLTISLNEIKNQATNKNQLESFTLQAKNSYKVFSFKIAPEDEATENLSDWVSIILLNLQKSQGLTKEIQNRDYKYKYWKTRVISEANFQKKVDTFDILLMRGMQKMAKVQRFFTGSDYDHVAIFLRSGEDLYFLEATGDEGVGLCKWSTFVKNKWYLLYERLTFRHLKIERSGEILEQFQEFLKTVLRNDYEISVKKLMKFQSHIGKIEEYQGRTFFCSELVASAYKVIKVLNGNISAAQYWPGSFSKANKSLPLIKECKLGDEYLIEFE